MSGKAGFGDFVISAIFNITPPAPVDGQRVPLQADSAGNLLVNAAVVASQPSEVPPGTTAPAKVDVVAGKSNDATPQYQPIPEGAGGRSVIVEGVAGGVAQPVSGNVNQAIGNAGFEKITDGANTAAVKAASTAAAAADPSLVVALSPNSPVPTGANTIGSVKVTDGTTVAGVIAGTTALKTDLSSVAGTATSTAAAGVQKVGVVGGAGTSLETTAGVLDENIKNVGNSAIATAAAGVQKVGIVGNANATLDSTIGAAPAPTNALATSAVYQTTIPALTAGQAVAAQCDTTGSRYVNTEGRKATYRTDFSGAAIVGKFVTFFGSATKIIRITRIRITADAGTSAATSLLLVKCSSAPVGGTSTTLSLFALDSNNAVSTVTNANLYSVVPTGGLALVGNLDQVELVSLGTTTISGSAAASYDMIYGLSPGTSHVVLRTTSEGIAIQSGATSINFRGFIEWTEE